MTSYEADPLWLPLAPLVPVDPPLLVGRLGRSVRGLVIAGAGSCTIATAACAIATAKACGVAKGFVGILPSASYFFQ